MNVTKHKPKYQEDTVNLPLSLIKNQTASNRKNAVTLILDGDYLLKSRRFYADKQPCAFCGTIEKAKEIAVLIENQGQLTEREILGGLDCLFKHYGVDRQNIEQKIKESMGIRISASRFVQRNFSTTEEMFEKLADWIDQFTPTNALKILQQNDLKLARELAEKKSDEAKKLLNVLFSTSQYFRDWVINPERACARWTALKTHPKFLQGNKKLNALCNLVLETPLTISREQICELRRFLDQAAKFKANFPALVLPENCETDLDYRTTLYQRLEVRVKSEVYEWAYWKDSEVLPGSVIGFSKALYAGFAVDPGNLKNFSRKIEESLKKRNLASVTYFDPKTPTRTYRDQLRVTKRDEDNLEYEEFIEGPKRNYKVLGIHIIQPFTETHRLWKQWGRIQLEQMMYDE